MLKIFFLILFLLPNIASAYIGPGMSGGFLAALIGFILAIIIAIVGIFYYPIKKFIKYLKAKRTKK